MYQKLVTVCSFTLQGKTSVCSFLKFFLARSNFMYSYMEGIKVILFERFQLFTLVPLHFHRYPIYTITYLFELFL
jgi:hypothetical protein